MEDSIEHRLSALLDGETSEFETRRLVEEINKNPEIKNLWIRMNKTKSLLTAEIDFSPRNIASSVMEELDASNIKQVKFSKDWKKDASRRDFTINSIYSDKEGNLFDPYNGKNDLEIGQINFIGDPEKRILEDYLRILRFFDTKFHERGGQFGGHFGCFFTVWGC